MHNKFKTKNWKLLKITYKLLTKLSTNILFKSLVLLLIALFVSNNVVSQSQKIDSLAIKADSIIDSGAVQRKLEEKKKSMNLKTKAIYKADDSLRMDRANDMLYLYHKCVNPGY